jgi:hypothetical protein
MGKKSENPSCPCLRRGRLCEGRHPEIFENTGYPLFASARTGLAGMTIIQLISGRYHRRHTREGGYPVFKTTFYDSIELASKKEEQKTAIFPQRRTVSSTIFASKKEALRFTGR